MAVIVFILIVQSNYFATKLDIVHLKLELKEYSDNQDKEILKDLDAKYTMILNKLDKLR